MKSRSITSAVRGSSVPARLSASLAVWLIGAGWMAAQATPSTGGPSTGIIVGRVVDADSKNPIASAVVTLAPNEPQQPVLDAARTNGDGVFVLVNIPAGSWSLSAARPGYTWTTGTSRMPLTIASGQHISGLVVPLRKYASLSGTVRDEDDGALAGVPVQLFYRQTPTQWTALPPVVTDDRGRYLFSTLQSRDYILAVVSAPATISPDTLAGFERQAADGVPLDVASGVRTLVTAMQPHSDNVMRVGAELLRRDSVAVPPEPASNGLMWTYPTTYYPGVRSAGSAQLIHVDRGAVLKTVDLRLTRVRTASVTGVLQSSQYPIAGLPVRLVTSEVGGPESTVATTYSDSAGRFRFPLVPAGTYLLKVSRTWTPEKPSGPVPVAIETPSQRIVPPASSGSRDVVPSVNAEPPDRAVYVVQPVAVGDGDVRDLVVPLVPGHRIRGRLEFQGVSSRPVPEQLGAWTVQFWAYDNGSSNYFSTRPDRDGRFVSPGLPPGRYTLRAVATSMPEWQTKSFQVDGRELVDEPFTVTGQDVLDAVIILSDRLPATIGTAFRPDGLPAGGASVLMFPVDRSRWTSVSANASFRTTLAGPNGRFSFPPITPGDYFLAASLEAPDESWRLTESLQALASRATRVRAIEGDPVVQDLAAAPEWRRPSSRSAAQFQTVYTNADSTLGGEPFVAARTRQKQTQNIGASGSTILGSVLDDQTGDPLARVLVTLRPVSGAPARTELTDATGTFVFESISSDRFRLTAARPGYLTLEHGAKRFGGPGVAFPVAEASKELTPIRLVRAASIAGRVLDELGQPVPTAVVRALLLRQANGDPVLVPAPSAGPGRVTTDSAGRYRCYGLPAGDYYVGVTAGASGGTTPGHDTSDDLIAWAKRQNRSTKAAPALDASTSGPSVPPTIGSQRAYGSALFPGSDMSTAQIVSILPGESREGVDIRLFLVPTSTITGSIVMPDGSPAARASLAVVPVGPYVPTDGGLLGANGNVYSLGGAFTIAASPQGQFRVMRLAAGRYTFIATATDPHSGATLLATHEVVAGEADPAPLTIGLQPGRAVQGSLRTDDGKQPVPSAISIELLGVPSRSHGNVAVSSRAVAVDATSRFTIPDVLPGQYVVNVKGVPTPYVVSAISSGNRDVLDEGFVVDANQDSDITITLTSRPASLSGRLLNQGETPATEYMIVVLPTNRRLWSTRSPRVQMKRPDADGEFAFAPLLPGEYLLCALTDVDSSTLDDPSVQEAIVAGAIRLTVQQGRDIRQDLRIAR